jgi:hypothetical protein
MNEMDKNKLSINNFSKLITQEQFLQKEPCSQGNNGLSCPREQSCSQGKKGA